MRFIKAILSVLLLIAAVVGGIITVLVVAIAALFGRRRIRSRTGDAGPATKPAPADVIEVSATEIPNR